MHRRGRRLWSSYNEVCRDGDFSPLMGHVGGSLKTEEERRRLLKTPLLAQSSIHHESQCCLMLTGYPVSCTGNQVEIAARAVAKDILERGILRGVECDVRDMKAELLAVAL